MGSEGISGHVQRVWHSMGAGGTVDAGRGRPECSQQSSDDRGPWRRPTCMTMGTRDDLSQVARDQICVPEPLLCLVCPLEETGYSSG